MYSIVIHNVFLFSSYSPLFSLHFSYYNQTTTIIIKIGMHSTGNFKESINSVNFNHDNTFVALATSIGFKIYSTQPFALRHERDFGTPLQIV